LLPFRKRRGSEDPIELSDEDLVVIEDESIDVVLELPQAPQPGPRAARLRTVSALEDDVAGECLASIASIASSDAVEAVTDVPARESVNPRPLTPPTTRRSGAPPSSRPFVAPWSRLPTVTAPPFSRPAPLTQRSSREVTPVSTGLTARRGSAPSAPSAFARRSSPHLEQGVVTNETRGTSSASGSIAPVSMGQADLAPQTVVIVRERPKARWVIGSAALGAVAALLAARFAGGVGGSDEATPAPAQVATTTIATAVVAAGTAPAPSVSVRVVRFDESEGVEIPRPVPPATPAATLSLAPAAAAPVTSPASTPVSAAPVSATVSHASSSPSPASASPASASHHPRVAPPSPSPVAPPPARRPLTPEQELAEAQLRASMR